MRLVARPGAFPVGAAVTAALLVAIPLIGFLHLDHLGFTTCAFKAATGLPCGTCGTTRALGRLSRGDVAGAFAMNPLAMAAAAAFAAWAIADLVLRRARRSLRIEASRAEWRLLAAAAAAAFVANWAYLIAVGR